MKKLYPLFIALFATVTVKAQTTIASFDFNGSASLPVSASSTGSNITASINGTEANAAYSGTATGTGAFTQNTTAGDALSMANSSGTNTRYWTLTLGGSDLNKYINYKVYFQSEHSTTGATIITISYSMDGSTYTALSQTVAPGLNTTYTEAIVDLSGATTINNQTAVYIRFAASGASGTGTLRIDNLEIQAATSPWTMSGGNVNFTGGVTATSFTITGDARVTGALTSAAATVSSLTNSGNLNVAGTTTLTGAVTTGAIMASSINASGNLNVAGTTTLGNLTINQSIASPMVVTTHILSPDTNGVHIGDSSMIFNSYPTGNPTYDNMRGGSTKLSIGNVAKAFGANSIAIGSGGTTTNGPVSYAFGWNVNTATAANNAMALGSGFLGHPMLNNTPYSLAVGFNSDIPTFFVGGGSGATGSLGKVGIGTTSPAALLHVSSNSSTPTDYAFAVSDFVSPNSMIFGVQNNGSVHILDIASDNNALFTIAHFNGSTLSFLANGTGDITSSGPLRPYFNSGDFSIYEGTPGSGTLRLQVASGGAVTIPELISTTGVTSSGPYRPLLVDATGKLVSNAQVTGGSSGSAWVLGGNASSGATLGSTDADLPFIAGGNERMRVMAAGNVIIGGSGGFGANTSVTMGRADYGGGSGADLGYGTSYIGFNAQRTSITGTTGSWTTYSDFSHNGGSVIFGNVGGDICFASFPSTSNGGSSATYSDAQVKAHQAMRIGWNTTLNSGQVVIGNKNPIGAHADALLAVYGKVLFTSAYVNVDPAVWADYVFEKNYKLMDLLEVEKYYRKHKHLNGVPSAEEIASRGDNIVETDAMLLKKIEENTLYLVELKKEIDELKKENAVLKETVNKKK